jgi:hypothetical protein
MKGRPAYHLAYMDITCPSCGQQNRKQIIDLVDRDAIPCDFCDDPIDLKPHRAAIKQSMELFSKFTELGSP